MPRFDLDAQRGLTFLFGVIGFATEAVVVWLGGPRLPDLMTGGLISMIVGPLGANTIDKYREIRDKRQEQEAEELRASQPVQPPSSSPPAPPTTTTLSPSKDGEK